MTITIAKFETKNFEFYGYGEDSTEAIFELSLAFKRHMQNTGGTMTWDEIRESVTIQEIVPGTNEVR